MRVRHAMGLVGITALFALFAGKLFGLFLGALATVEAASELSEPTTGTAR